MNKPIIKTIFLFTLSVVISSCATPYQRKSFTGGYSDFKIQDSIYRVSFVGNGFSDIEKASNFALLRSAEIALKNGFDYFIIIESNHDYKDFSIVTPSTSHTSGKINLSTPSYGSNISGDYSSNTVHSGGGIFNVHKPRAHLTIQCFHEKPQNIDSLVYDPRQIISNLSVQ